MSTVSRGSPAIIASQLKTRSFAPPPFDGFAIFRGDFLIEF
jgi:hypothetical protein